MCPVSTIQQAGLPVAAPWCGIRQHTFDELEDSLLQFSTVYEVRPDLRRQCREQVIAAKDRAKTAIRSANGRRETRRRTATMAEWMLIWLGDPAIFRLWVRAIPLRDC